MAPGYLHSQVDTDVPELPETWQSVMDDIHRVIMPGITHWQSPNFHAYYPTQTSYPAIVGSLLASGLGVVGFSWVNIRYIYIMKILSHNHRFFSSKFSNIAFCRFAVPPAPNWK